MQHRNVARRHQTRAAAFSIIIEMAAIFTMTMLTMLALVSNIAKAETINLDELEEKIWTADEHELFTLENRAARFIQQQPESAFGHYLMAHTIIRLFTRDPGNLLLLKQATELSQQAVDLEPHSDVGYIALADILDLSGHPERALTLLNDAKAAGLKPSWRFYFSLSRLAADTKRPEAVLSLLETALSFSDTKPKIIVPYIIAILQAEHRGPELIAKLQDWHKRFPSNLFLLTKAISYSEQKQIKEAHQLYTQILETSPNDKEAKVNDAILLYRDMKNPDKAIKMFDEVIKSNNASLTVSMQAMILAHLGAAYIDKKNFATAEKYFIDALRKQRQNFGLIDFITQSYRSRNHYKQLVSLLEKLNINVPGSGVLHALLGETLSERLEDHRSALNAFADAITLEPARSDFYNGMGLTYYRMKNYKEALKLFNVATEVDPNDATAHYNEACMLALLGRKEEALGSLREAFNIDPRLTEVARSDGDLASMHELGRFRDLVGTPLDTSNKAVGH